MNIPRQLPPNVTVNVPEAKPPIINVAMPEGPAKATGPQEVAVVSMPARVKQARRNKKGEIEGTVEMDG